MKRFFLLLFLAIPLIILAQSLKTGYQYFYHSGNSNTFKYERKYYEKPNEYTTIYKIYHPSTGQHAITVTAVHYKSEKRVHVKVEDSGGGIFSLLSESTFNYKNPRMGLFGEKSLGGALGDTNAPNTISLKFVSNKFENVNVISIVADESNGEYFLLDD